jgi:hypothetical protein
VCYLREGISRENLEAAGTSGEKVVRRSYQKPDFYLYYMNLDFSNKGTVP